ncbi:MAG: class I SAM-dependent methyltransferase, partial [Leptolyngbyaceae cyanobacterium RM2_2_21]|nr:class I SAM-dependent methyltransferase [Leptolyngbyaceae cyanobacterium RM2_2_21]
QVYGVDFATAQLAIARQRSQKVWPPLVVDWVEADVLALPFEDAYFDGATMGYGLRNVADIPASLKELRRVLKPGSAAAILDFHRPASSLMQKFQQWYLSTIVVPTAEAYGLGSEYAYISPSLDRFLSGSAQVSSALQSGFSDAVHYPIVGGMMGVLVATR